MRGRGVGEGRERRSLNSRDRWSLLSWLGGEMGDFDDKGSGQKARWPSVLAVQR